MNQQIIKQITTLNVAPPHNQERKQVNKGRMRQDKIWKNGGFGALYQLLIL